MTWEQAYKYCFERNMRLISSETQEKADIIYGFMQATGMERLETVLLSSV